MQTATGKDAMYEVIIRRKHWHGNWRIIDRAEFPIGQWKEIGYWLDDCGYIETDTKVEVTVK